MKKVIVIGGGAAGMMAAARAGERGFDVHLYEKNNKLGKKIYITGKGRCNLTNDSDIDNFIENIPNNPYFLYSAFYTLDSTSTQALFHDLGLQTKVERGNRVFPVSDKASDVILALEKYCKKNGVKIHLDSCVKELIIENEQVQGILLSNGTDVKADAVIVATGGLSYPATGSTGDGYKMAKQAGHIVTKLHPSLVPLKAKEIWCADLMGLSLKNVAIAVKDQQEKVLYKDFGEMLFTHYGVSGPMILSASTHLIGKLEQQCKITIDLKPALDEKTLDSRILRDFEKYKNKNFKNALEDLLPQKLISIIVSLCGIDAEKKVHDITKEERKQLIYSIKNLTITVYETAGYKEAVITSGGIDVNEIDPANMESKLIKNLHFIGEVLNVDGYTGGYNLQIAFSTGYTAGNGVFEK